MLKGEVIIDDLSDILRSLLETFEIIKCCRNGPRHECGFPRKEGNSLDESQFCLFLSSRMAVDNLCKISVKQIFIDLIAQVRKCLVKRGLEQSYLTSRIHGHMQMVLKATYCYHNSFHEKLKRSYQILQESRPNFPPVLREFQVFAVFWLKIKSHFD